MSGAGEMLNRASLVECHVRQSCLLDERVVKRILIVEISYIQIINCMLLWLELHRCDGYDDSNGSCLNYPIEKISRRRTELATPTCASPTSSTDLTTPCVPASHPLQHEGLACSTQAFCRACRSADRSPPNGPQAVTRMMPLYHGGEEAYNGFGPFGSSTDGGGLYLSEARDCFV